MEFSHVLRYFFTVHINRILLFTEIEIVSKSELSKCRDITKLLTKFLFVLETPTMHILGEMK